MLTRRQFIKAAALLPFAPAVRPQHNENNVCQFCGLEVPDFCGGYNPDFEDETWVCGFCRRRLEMPGPDYCGSCWLHDECQEEVDV